MLTHPHYPILPALTTDKARQAFFPHHHPVLPIQTIDQARQAPFSPVPTSPCPAGSNNQSSATSTFLTDSHHHPVMPALKTDKARQASSSPIPTITPSCRLKQFINRDKHFLTSSHITLSCRFQLLIKRDRHLSHQTPPSTCAIRSKTDKA